jgi:hypothetical protein
MSPWAACRLIQEHSGIDTVLHFPTRGRNLLRVQGDLLAAHALGIRNVFVCMGDPTALGDHPEAASDTDVAPTGLIALITQAFNHGKDRAGASIGEATRFLAGTPNGPCNWDPAGIRHEFTIAYTVIDCTASNWDCWIYAYTYAPDWSSYEYVYFHCPVGTSTVLDWTALQSSSGPSCRSTRPTSRDLLSLRKIWVNVIAS